MICSVILAAGESTRMSHPKQLLKINGKSLIKRITGASLDSNSDHTIVVVGANSKLVKAEIEELPITIVTNPDWAEGMGRSIRAGMEFLLAQESDNEKTEAIIIMLCDQPFVDSHLINHLINEYHTKKTGIVACNYGEITGVPALFTETYFNELLSLKGEKGARSVIKKATKDICTIAFPHGVVDIDTDGDFDFFNDN